MLIKRIILKNIGPISDLHIEPRVVDGKPVPLILVGQNGAGKSLLLSCILDAITEARRAVFRKLFEVELTDYLRVSQKTYVRQSSQYSHANVVLSNGDRDLIFDEVVSMMKWEQFQEEAPSIAGLPNLVTSEFPQSGFFKRILVGDDDKAAVQSQSFLYFPFFRYELPAWLQENAKIQLGKPTNYYGSARINPIRSNVIAETSQWILNLVLDRELYERVSGNLPNVAFPVIFGYSGPNTLTINLINSLLTDMMKAKSPEIESARVGVSPKGNRSISVHVKRTGRNEEVVATDLSYLSSGEAMCLAMGAEIIRGHEIVAGLPNDLKDVTGIVLIDEIDLHLHIEFQKAVLPQLIRRFPLVQFIITTHSPFFLLGMAESGGVDIYSLPIGNSISPEEFSEFQVAYDVFVDANQRFKERFEQLSAKATEAGGALIITEGKTDWQHLKLALAALRAAGQYVDLDVEFLEFGDDLSMNDTKLAQMCEHVASLPVMRNTIFMFDRDNPTYVQKMSGAPNSYKKWSDRVYSFCIPTPPHRDGYEKISIEFYYSDEDIRTRDPETNKRLWFSNEVRGEIDFTTKKQVPRALAAPIAQSEFQKVIFDTDASRIVDDSGLQVGLSKSAFVEAILGNAEIGPNIDRAPFASIFDVVQKIVAAVPG